MDITKFEVEQTMTLKEITDLLEVRHNDAMAVVRKLIENQEFGLAARVSHPIISGKGREQLIETYQLNKRQSIAVAAKLNTSLLMRIIDRWQELENQTRAYHLPTTFHEALRMLADESEKNLILENKIKDDLPYTSFAKKIENSSNAIPLGVYSKILKIKDLGPNNMIKFLRENGILIKSGRRKNCPLQKYIQSGWFEIKESTFKTPKGQQVIGFTTLITGSGQIEITKKFGWNYPLDMD